MDSKIRLYHAETGEPSPELWPLDAVDWQANGWLTEPPPEATAVPKARRRGTPDVPPASESAG